jgi:hypothetical protein
MGNNVTIEMLTQNVNDEIFAVNVRGTLLMIGEVIKRKVLFFYDTECHVVSSFSGAIDSAAYLSDRFYDCDCTGNMVC